MNTDPRLLQRLYTERFEGAEEKRRRLWQVLVEDFFQAFVRPDDCVVDVAAGEGLFLAPLRARRRIAIDLRPPPRDIDPDIEWRNESWRTGLRPAEANVIFVSNFLEHLGSKEEVLNFLGSCAQSLRAGGRLLILQPNIRLVREAYWDFFDHKIPLTDKSLVEGLSLANFQVTHLISRFLPYTSKSRMPQNATLVRLYLRLPVLWRFFGKQSFVIACKPGEGLVR